MDYRLTLGYHHRLLGLCKVTVVEVLTMYTGRKPAMVYPVYIELGCSEVLQYVG